MAHTCGTRTWEVKAGRGHLWLHSDFSASPHSLRLSQKNQATPITSWPQRRFVLPPPFQARVISFTLPPSRNLWPAPWAPTLLKIFVVFSLQLLNSSICLDYHIAFSCCSCLHILTLRNCYSTYNLFSPPLVVLEVRYLVYLFHSGSTTQHSSQLWRQFYCNPSNLVHAFT